MIGLVWWAKVLIVWVLVALPLAVLVGHWLEHVSGHYRPYDDHEDNNR